MFRRARGLGGALVAFAFASACTSNDPDGAAADAGPGDRRDGGDGDAAPGGPDAAPDASVAIDCIDAAGPGDHTFTCDGVKFDVAVPASCPEAGCGLIVDVHGGTMSAEMEDASTEMRARGTAAGFVVVQPSAQPGPPSSSWEPDADDPAVFGFIQEARAVWDIDPRRIHMTGFSQGAAMSWRFLCEHPDVLASIAPAAEGPRCPYFGGTPSDCFQDSGRVPAGQRPVLFMHGTQDAVVDFSCGAEIRDAVRAGWDMGAPQVVSQDGDHLWTRSVNPSGTVFEFIEHDYQASSSFIDGHCFPGSDDDGGASGQLFSFACEGTPAFTWGAIALQFFLDHPRP